ncbi:MAG: monovalent cation/H(+) antiporter subunit G [Verrucomicrobia bacterium]|nr:monovalent cation/H(+) antiporter subunit G [Verrucomicrobiota bacterium]
MFEIAISIVSGALICGGLVFFLGAAVGLVRFPDFYTRMHSAGKGDTLSTIMILLGIALYQFHDLVEEVHSLQEFLEVFKIELLVAIKVAAISAFIMLTSPTSTHALMEAGYDDGVEPFTRGDDGANDMAAEEQVQKQVQKQKQVQVQEPEGK